MTKKKSRRKTRPGTQNPVEMGTISYKNLSEDGTHGVLEYALEAIDAAPSKPVFVNFVEWDGCSGSKEAGKIFADPNVKRAAEECFTPVVFNTWDRYEPKWNEAFRRWVRRKMLLVCIKLRVLTVAFGCSQKGWSSPIGDICGSLIRATKRHCSRARARSQGSDI